MSKSVPRVPPRLEGLVREAQATNEFVTTRRDKSPGDRLGLPGLFIFFGEVGCAQSAIREFVSQKTQGDELEGLRVHSVMGKRGAE